jgi:hypothetical protein
MRRREFIAGLGAAAAWPLVARAQQPARMRRIGVLAGDDPDTKARLSAFTQGLTELGWTEGRNLRMDVRWTPAGNVNRMRMFAKELVDLQPDVMLAVGTPVTAALRRERASPTRSSRASWRACPARAEILPGSSLRKRHSGASGWSCSPRSRPASSESQ